MKIYPSKANIAVTNEVNLNTEIPLSYIDTNASSYSYNVIPAERFKNEFKKEILPYSVIDIDSCFFDKDSKEISNKELIKNIKRIKDKYYYIPFGSISFTPEHFKYRVIAKKKMKYKSNNIYNFNIAIQSSSISNNFMSISGDAPKRGLAPLNININNNDLSISSFVRNTSTDCDFLIMAFADANNVLSESAASHANDFNINNIIAESNINLIKSYAESFATKDWTYAPTVTEEPTNIKDVDPSLIESLPLSTSTVEMKVHYKPIKFKLKNPIIYNDLTFSSEYYFNIPTSTKDHIYSSIFDDNRRTPILIEELVGKGFIVHMDMNILLKASDNYKLIYEILTYIYFNAYSKTNYIEDWITNTIPDYIVSNNKLVKKDKFTTMSEFYKLFDMQKEEISLYDVEIPQKYNFVKYVGVIDDYVIFEKDNSLDHKDPEKPQGYYSIYTNNKNIIYFNSFLYAIDESIENKMNIQQTDDQIIINLQKYKNSSAGINIKEDPQPLIIDLKKIIDNKEIQIDSCDYYLVCASNEDASYFDLKKSDIYVEKDGNILATIQIKKKNENKIIYDIRKRGGGIPLTEKDNFDCFDIGHVNGRPYRKGGSVIITLPKRLEKYKDIIEDTINQYKTAQVYPIIIFKEG